LKTELNESKAHLLGTEKMIENNYVSETGNGLDSISFWACSAVWYQDLVSMTATTMLQTTQQHSTARAKESCNLTALDGIQ